MKLFQELSPDYLICDARHPLICGHYLQDELLLYNLDKNQEMKLYAHFAELCGKSLCPSFKTQELSGGQKVILMALLALLSPAPSLAFINLFHNLDEQRSARLREIMRDSTVLKTIKWVETDEDC